MMTLEEYYKRLTPEQTKIMSEIRRRVKKLVPQATEAMGYGVPAFRLNGKPILYYAAFREHVGIYPAADEIITKIPELKPYRAGKGTFKFPLNADIPYLLIEKFVRFKCDSLS